MNRRLQPQTLTRYWVTGVLGAVVVSILGGFFIAWTAQRQNEWMREELTDELHLLTQTIHGERIRELTAEPLDDDCPAYQRLQSQFTSALQINPTWRRMALFGRKPDNSIFFYLEVAALHEPPAFARGTFFTNQNELICAAYDDNRITICGPMATPRGIRVQAFSGVRFPPFQTPIMLGLEADASHWRLRQWQAIQTPLWAILTLLGVWILGHVLFARRRRRRTRSTSFLGRNLEVMLAVITGLTLTGMAAWLVATASARSRQMAFHHFADKETQPTTDTVFEIRRRELAGFAAFFASSDHVDKDEFANYAQHLAQAPELVYWTWSEVVAATNQLAFVKEAARRSGQRNYRLWERSRKGKRVPVRPREDYYPIVYVSPSHNQEDVLGFDLGADPKRRAAIEEALATGFATTTDPITLLPGTARGILAVHPVFDPQEPHQLLGVVGAGMKVRDWLTTGRVFYPDRHVMTTLDLWNLQAGHKPIWLGTTATPPPAQPPPFETSDYFTVVRPIFAFGKTYVLTARPRREFYQLYPLWAAKWAVASGVVLTGLLAWVLSLLVHRRQRLAQLVEEQYHELMEAMRRHRALAEETRALTWEVDTQGFCLNIGDFAEELLGYQPDELVGHLRFTTMIPPSHRVACLARFREIIHQGVPFTNIVHPLTTKSDEVIWVSTSGIPTRNAAGQLTGFWGTTMDISARILAEEALRESEQRYRTLFEEMREGFALHEMIWNEKGQPVNYRFLAVNPAFERMTGLTADKIIGRTILDVLPGTEPSWIITYGQVTQTGNPVFFDNYSAMLEKHFEVAAFRPAPGQFACVFSDITERKNAELELRESRRQYAALLGNLPGMVYRCLNDPHWTMEIVSEGGRALTGYEPDDLIGNRTVSFNDMIHPHHRETVRAQWQACLQEKQQFSAEYEIITRQGEHKWVWELGGGVYDETGRVIALEGFVTDITSLKQARVERERLMTAIEQSQDSVIITDAQGIIQYVNPAFSRIAGYARQEMIGQQPDLLKSGQQESAYFDAMWRHLQSGQPWEGSFINRAKDGRLYTEMASISPVVDEAGRITNYVAVSRDITQELEEAKERESLQAQLQQAQKMESFGRLAGGVAHDFNNMLQAILGYAELALEQVAPDQPVYGDLTEIQKVAQRSAALTQQLQLFARRQTLARELLELNDTISGLLPMFHHLAGADIEVIWQPQKDLPPVRIEVSQVDQLATNLFINARDALSGSGQIVIKTQHRTVTNIIHSLHGDITPGDYVVLSVADDGCGIPPDVLPHIFEPFFTTKKAGQGVGLGLATVYGIVQQSRGVIHMQSQVGKGTTLQVYLPSQTRGNQPPATNAATREPIPSSPNQETILMVDDVATLLATTRRMLESLQYRVLATTSPTEALQLLKDHAGQIDLLLVDVMMPETSGPKLVRQALAKYPQLKYLYMSGFPADLITEEGMPEDTPNFIAKPFTRSEIAQKIRAILNPPR